MIWSQNYKPQQNILWDMLNFLSFFNTLRPRQNGHHFPDDTFKRIFLNENIRISIKISLKFVPMGPFNNNPALVQIMAWRLSGDKPLSEAMMVSLLTHTCVTRPQWVKGCLMLQDASSNRRPLFECTRCSLSSPSFDDLFNHLSVHDGLSLSTTTQQQPASTSRAEDTIQGPADNQPAIVLLSSDSESDNDDLEGFQVDLEDSPDEDCDEDCVVID